MRHGAKSVTNFELLPKPPASRGRDNPWPQWPKYVCENLFEATLLISIPGFSAQTMVIQKSLRISVTVSLSNTYISPHTSAHNLDPREYCISTKDYVLNDEGTLEGLNTGG